MAKKIKATIQEEIEDLEEVLPEEEENSPQETTYDLNQPFVHVTPNVNTGLNSSQVEERQKRNLSNVINIKQGKTIPQIILSKIFNIFNIICFAIAALIIFIEREEAMKDLVFLFIMISNTAIGIFQEIQSKRTLDKLSFDSAPKYIALRNGQQVEINNEDIVVDDILILSAGQKIPADGKIRFGKIEVNESLITGESVPISKGVGASVYGGSFIVSGSAKIQMTKVGTDSYIQNLATQAKRYQKPKSEILGSINTYIKVAVTVIIPTIFILLLQIIDFDINKIGNLVNPDEDSSKLIGLFTAILGVLPTGLVLLTSIALFSSVRKLGKKEVMVQELFCIEMLARIDTLCLDKTGTITDGTMSVLSVKFLQDDSNVNIKQIVANMLYVTKDANQTADALEAKFGRAKRCKSYACLPFSSARKYSAVSFSEDETYILGAPEFISKELYKTFSKEITNESRKGNRVIMLARTDKAIKDNRIGGKAEAIALIIIQDNIRESAPKTLNYFKNNNVKVLVISGDNPLTVSAIAKKAGVRGWNKYINMSEIKDEDIPKIIEDYIIFGRVTPNQKQLIVKCLKERGHTVAMTGDGVNDILALKEADCSIAMASGSEAARNVSQLVLTNDDFGAMPYIVAEGRKVINNIAKVATLFISKNLFCFFICVFVIMMNFNLFFQGEVKAFPLMPGQLSLIDTLTIGIPATILALSPNNKQISGKFMINVLKNALPGALVILVNAVCIYTLAAFDSAIPEENIPTLITISTSITCLVILIRVFMPMNFWKVFVIFGISVLLILVFQFSLDDPEAKLFGFLNFELKKIVSSAEWLLLICLAQASYVLIWIFSLSFMKIIHRFIKNEINSWMNNLDNDVEIEDDIIEQPNPTLKPSSK